MTDAGKTVDMPMKMAVSIAQNPDAVKAFARLSESRRSEFINRAKTAGSREEMTKIVGEIAALR